MKWPSMKFSHRIQKEWIMPTLKEWIVPIIDSKVQFSPFHPSSFKCIQLFNLNTPPFIDVWQDGQRDVILLDARCTSSKERGAVQTIHLLIATGKKKCFKLASFIIEFQETCFNHSRSRIERRGIAEMRGFEWAVRTQTKPPPRVRKSARMNPCNMQVRMKICLASTCLLAIWFAPPVDIAEDLAIGHGYEDLGTDVPKAPMNAIPRSDDHLRRRIRTSMQGKGFMQIQSPTLSNDLINSNECVGNCSMP